MNRLPEYDKPVPDDRLPEEALLDGYGPPAGIDEAFDRVDQSLARDRGRGISRFVRWAAGVTAAAAAVVIVMNLAFDKPAGETGSSTVMIFPPESSFTEMDDFDTRVSSVKSRITRLKEKQTWKRSSMSFFKTGDVQ